MAAKQEIDRFEESLASKPFLFVVGQERKEFHIHREIVGQLSPALNALVNGGMKESREGRVEWLDLEVDTFVRFAKFAYTGDYAEAEPEDLSPTPPPSVQQQPNSPEQQDLDLSDHESADQEEGADEGFSSAEDDDEESQSASEESSEGVSGESEDLEDLEDLENEDENGVSQENEEPDIPHGTDDLRRVAATMGYHPRGISYNMPSLPPFSSDFVCLSRQAASQATFQQSLSKSPYSIRTYMNAWENHLRDRLLVHEPDIVGNILPSKRRWLDSGEWRATSSANNLKYDAMRRFTTLDIPQPSLAEERWRPRANTTIHECFEPLFLSHARLYVLADKYGVDNLKTVTLHRLHVSLASFTVFPERVRDLVALIYVIYDNTVANDMARCMIVQFFSCVAEHVKGCDEFRCALRSDGDFADDLFQEMTSRLL